MDTSTVMAETRERGEPRLTREISSSGWINLLVALVVVRVAGLLVMEGDGLAAVLLVVLVVDMVD